MSPAISLGLVRSYNTIDSVCCIFGSERPSMHVLQLLVERRSNGEQEDACVEVCFIQSVMVEVGSNIKKSRNEALLRTMILGLTTSKISLVLQANDLLPGGHIVAMRGGDGHSLIYAHWA